MKILIALLALVAVPFAHAQQIDQVQDQVIKKLSVPKKKNYSGKQPYAIRRAPAAKAYAKQNQQQQQQQAQQQGQDQGQEQSLENFVDVTTQLSPQQDQANAQQVNFEGTPVVTLVPNNNTENCLRVIGLSFANSSGGGGLGWPYRSKKCDYEQTADDAFAQGQFKIGWYWKCQNKNLYKQFGSPEKCLSEMLGMFETVPNPEPVPLQVNVDVKTEEECCDDPKQCGSNHPEIHKRILERCMMK